MIEFTLKDNSKEVLAELEAKMPVILEKLGQAGENNAVMEITALGAVDTGNLRNSITHETDSDTAYVGTNVEYAPYVEFGTRRYPHERPFLRNAIRDHIEEYKSLIESELKS
jgi:HK97 gp10 family phage protein